MAVQLDVAKEALRILNEYPQLVPYPGFLKWEGFVLSHDREVPLEINTPHFPMLKDFTVKCPADVFPLLIPLISQAEGSSLFNFLLAISHALKSKSLFAAELLDVDKQKLQTLIDVLKELQYLGNERIVDLNLDEMTVTLSYEDSRGVLHEVTITFSRDYPKTPAALKKIDLPSDSVTALEVHKTLRQLYDGFRDTVEELIPFWEIVQQLDNNCWVIDPEVPQCKDIYRRIFLSTDLSVSVIFNPSCLNEMPEIKFFGCVSVVEQKRTEFMTNLEKTGWDLEEDVTTNLKRLLDIDEFPGKPSPTDNVQDPLECLICASSGVEGGALAQKWCNNDKCPSVYHRSCLYRWFDGLQTSKQYWDYICGPCPYCKVKIWCPVKD